MRIVLQIIFVHLLVVYTTFSEASSLYLRCDKLTNEEGATLKNIMVSVERRAKGWILTENYISGRTLSKSYPMRFIKYDRRAGGSIYTGGGYTFYVYKVFDQYVVVNSEGYASECKVSSENY